MHKTKTGRWVPDKPEPEPAPPRRGNTSYEGFLIHQYQHDQEPADNCVWCDPDLPLKIAAANPPWEVLGSITLRRAR